MPRQRFFPALWLTALQLFALLAATCAQAAPAPSDPRNVDATDFGQRLTLGPNWLFASGDNPAWASPAFDDSGWITVSSEKQLFDYGIRDIRYCWYRTHVHLRPGVHGVAVGASYTFGAYEVFVNGVRIGSAGKMGNRIIFRTRTLRAFSIPDGLIPPDGSLVLALRFAVEPSGTLGPGTSSPLKSTSATSTSRIFLISSEAVPREISYSASHNNYDDLLLGSLSFLASLVALGLCLAMRSRREYLVVTVYLLASTARYCTWFRCDTIAYTLPLYLLASLFTGIVNVAIIEFVRILLGRPHSRLLRGLEVAAFVSPFGTVLAVMGIGGTVNIGFFTFYLPILFVDVLLAVMLVRGWRQRNREARVLLPAVIVLSFGQTWTFLNTLVFYVGIIPRLHPMPTVPLGSYRFTVADICDLTFYITVLLFLVLRTIAIARRNAHVAAELEAAHTTQQLLLARASQPTPGFEVKTIYYPASEVGGDFFVVSTSPFGGLIAIIGDVAGKGLTAAMRVAMILGVLRRETSWEPAQVLHNLNNALLSNKEATFTTACCIHIDYLGAYTLANAGHIAPFVDGVQISTPPALPLGIEPDQHYLQISGNLSATQRLILLSDGVLEARSATGELLGFERLTALSTQPAEEVAQTAQAFGQDDDITVLTVKLAATGVVHA